RVPSIGEIALGLYPLDHYVKGENLSAHADAAAYRLSGREWPVNLHSEPFAELFGIGDRPPHARLRRLQRHLLFDPISLSHCLAHCGHMQPPGCIIVMALRAIRNPTVASSALSRLECAGSHPPAATSRPPVVFR